MFADQRLAELEKEKTALLVEAEVLRAGLSNQVSSIGQRCVWIGSLRQRLPAARPIVLAGAAAAGYLAFRNFRTLLRWTPGLVSAWRFARQVTRHFRV